MRPDPEEFDRGPLLRTPFQNWHYAAARELLEYVKALTEDAEGTEAWRLEPGAFRNIVIGTFARATKTYGAVLLLCDRGYGEQAGMLNRSLFEYTVTAWWMLEQDEAEVMDALRKHHDHARVLYERALETHPELKSEPEGEPEPLSAEYVAELDDKFGEHGGQWHKKRLDQLVREVEDSWDAPYANTLWKFFRFVNHWNNYMLHHSAVGVSEGVAWTDPDESPLVIMGPSSEWNEASLWAAFWIYGLIVQATLCYLEPDRLHEFRAYFEERAARFVEVTAEQICDVGRNDPCPCTSGLKFKHCHEPYVGERVGG